MKINLLDNSKKLALIQFGGVIVILLSTVWSKVSYTDSDALGALLLSKAISLEGTVHLDSMAQRGVSISDWALSQKGGHSYYYFPIGSSLLAIPVVVLLNLAAIDAPAHDHAVQVGMAAFCGIGVFLVMNRIARFFISPLQAVIAALLFWATTSLSSTLGTAYWSHDAAVLFGFLAIYGAFNPRLQQQRWFLISLALFLAYLSRPTMALLSPVLLIFMASRDVKWATKTALSLAVLMLGFVLFSEMVWRQPLPDYYLPSRLEAGEFSVALLGNMISPSRGLLIFSPLILALPLISPKRLDLNPEYRWWWLVAVLWPAIHWVVISRFPHWYGGHCYGPRLMVDVLPGLFILFLHYWPEESPPVGRLSILVFVASLAVWINAIQGLRNPETRMWNMRPNIATYPEHLFDWSYPQFLSNMRENNRRAAFLGRESNEISKSRNQ